MLEAAESFCKLVSKDRFSTLKDFALKKHSMFGSTYVCESTSSAMKQVKSENSNGLADETLNDSLRLAPLTLVLIKERKYQRRFDHSHHTDKYLSWIAICTCVIISMTHTLIFPFLVLTLVNLLFHTSFYWKCRASCHVFVKWPIGHK